jgi:histidinol-phosphate aminotransferase
MQIETVLRLIRPHLNGLKPYSSARDEFDSSASSDVWVFLDANENPNPTAFNRYPDPLQRDLKAAISQLKGVPTDSLFIGNGSDEAIDLIIRMFCTPAYHNVIIPSPTYGMYQVSAEINDVLVKTVPLSAAFDLDLDATLAAADDRTQIIFLCSPNNPTGNLMTESSVIRLLNEFKGIVVVDEAYIDFSGSESLVAVLAAYPNLIVLQTLSKAWGLAGLRLGMALAHPEIVAALNKIKPPYNISSLAQETARTVLGKGAAKDRAVAEILIERARVADALACIDLVQHVFPSNANFLLVRVRNAGATYDKLTSQHIVVRNRSHIMRCDECLRITIGTRKENDQLLKALSSL